MSYYGDEDLVPVEHALQAAEDAEAVAYADLDSDRVSRRLVLRDDPHAERAVLSACLLDGGSIVRAQGEGLAAEHFADGVRGKVWEAVEALSRAGEDVSPLTVGTWLEGQGHGRHFGMLSQLAAQLDRGHALEAHVRLLKGLSHRRAIVRAAAKLLRDGERTFLPNDALLEAALSTLNRLGSEASKPNEVEDRLALAESFLASLDAKPGEGRIPTPWASLTRMLRGGFLPGQLVIVGGRPAMGKSAFAAQVADDVAARTCGATYVSIEMGGSELAERSICRMAEVAIDGARDRRARAALASAAAKWAETGAEVIDAPGVRLTDLEARIRRLAARGCGLVVVDHAGLVVVDVDGLDNENARVGAVSKRLKILARDLGIVVVLLCQLSRRVEERTDKRPLMSDLRDSGNLEQDADIVLFLYREEYYAREKCKAELRGVAEVLVRKHRGGRTGDVLLKFNAEQTAFYDVAKGE